MQIHLFNDPPVVVKRKARPERETVLSVFSNGGGVQSSAIMAMIEQGDLPRPDLVIFADTGDEPPWVLDAIRKHQRIMPISIVRRPRSLSDDARFGQFRFISMPIYIMEDGKRSMMRRQCTNEFKIQPINDFIIDRLIQMGHAKVVHTTKGPRRVIDKTIQVEVIQGISLDEFQRANFPRGAGQPQWQINSYPLIDKRMTRQAALAYLAERGYPTPQKSSCIFCPFHDDDYWRFLKTDHPALFRRACLFDHWLRRGGKKRAPKLRGEMYLHRSCKPLWDVDFAIASTPLEDALGLNCGVWCAN